MSLYSNVYEEDMINLRELSQQQKNQRAAEIKERVLKQTHDIKLAANLSPTTKKLEVNESTKKLGEVIEKSQPENNIPQPAIELSPPSQPLENNEGVIYDTELENTLKNMKDNSVFFQTYEDLEHGWMWNGYPVKLLGGRKQPINDKNK